MFSDFQIWINVNIYNFRRLMSFLIILIFTLVIVRKRTELNQPLTR